MKEIQFKDYDIDDSFAPKSGGYGTVYKVKRKFDGKSFAIKVLHKEDENSVKRFKREVETIENKLGNNINIIQIVESNIDYEPFFYIMPFADDSLSNKISSLQQNKKLILDYFCQILDGIEYAHKKDIIHRDLKPENILVFNENNKEILKISDFGLLKSNNSDYSNITNSDVGTLAYMSPEQLNNWEVDETTDIYSLGKILYILFSKQKPIYIQDHPFVPQDIKYIIDKCTRDDPEKRFQSVSKLRDAIKNIMDDPHKYEIPRNRIINLINDLKLSNNKENIIEELDLVFATNATNEDIYINLFCDKSEKFFNYYHTYSKDNFYQRLKTYDSFISKSLPFEYTDDVAIFYKKIFHITTDFEIKKLILHRMLVMGKYHNRHFVRDEFLNIVYSLNLYQDNALLEEVLDENKDETWWLSKYIETNRLNKTIKDIFENYKHYSSIFPDSYNGRTIDKIFKNAQKTENIQLENYSKKITCFYICLVNYLNNEVNKSNYIKSSDNFTYIDLSYSNEFTNNISEGIKFKGTSPVSELKLLLDITFSSSLETKKILFEFETSNFFGKFDLQIKGKKDTFKINEKNIPDPQNYINLSYLLDNVSNINFIDLEEPYKYKEIAKLIIKKIEAKALKNIKYDGENYESINFRII